MSSPHVPRSQSGYFISRLNEYELCYIIRSTPPSQPNKVGLKYPSEIWYVGTGG